MENKANSIRQQAREIARKVDESGGNLQKCLPALRAYFGRDNSELISVANLVDFVNQELIGYFSRIRLKFKMAEKPWQGVVVLTTYEIVRHQEREIDTVNVDTNFKP